MQPSIRLPENWKGWRFYRDTPCNIHHTEELIWDLAHKHIPGAWLQIDIWTLDEILAREC